MAMPKEITRSTGSIALKKSRWVVVSLTGLSGRICLFTISSDGGTSDTWVGTWVCTSTIIAHAPVNLIWRLLFCDTFYH
jgi:hypothetical protein